MELTLADISKRLTLDVINHVFQVKTKSSDSVKSVKVTKAAPAGEGLISAVYRIHVAGSLHKATFVAKGLVSDLLLRQTLCCQDFFRREVLFFSEILPQLKELQKSLGAKENIQRNVPICYAYHDGDDEDYLLLEDLTESLCESVTNPTKNDMDVTLKMLAHLHALSMALKIEKPKVFSNLVNKLKDEVYYNKNNREWFAKYLQNAIEIDKQVLREEFVNETNVYYKKFLETVNNDVYGQLLDILSDVGDHPTMNHGDAWLPNFMYSKERAVMIDFQLFRCASPATDLTYYLALCGDLCSTKEEFHKAVNTYYSFFEYYLADVGLDARKIFSREDLDGELKKYGRYGLLAGITTIPLLASKRCDVTDTSFQEKYDGVERIPLECLWKLVPMTDPEHRNKFVNTVRCAVDVGLI